MMETSSEQAMIPSLSCPSCQSAMIPRERGGVHVDVCEPCRSVWFDAGELESYRASRDRALGKLPDPARASAAAVQNPSLTCPRCAAASAPP